jgi:4-azaleucine resistance transporter AzlC
VLRQALSIGIAVAPFGVAFGVACVQAGLSPWQSLGFSALVFGGSSQFAAVKVLSDGGGAVAAILAGLLLALRSLAFGVVMAPDLTGPRWWRALVSQLMIDESLAVATAQATPALRRYGYLAGGLSVFVLWNAATLVGAVAFGSAGDLVEQLGIDATIPAAFLALLWPRLQDPTQRAIAAVGALIAVAMVPVAPPGVPIIASLCAVGVVLAARRPRTGRAAT